MDNNLSVCFSAKIEQINPIEGADKIVQAIISGWECVIQKDLYSVGDYVIIATTDAVIPENLADALNVKNYLKHRKRTEQYTVKTTKLKGVYSSALIISTKEEGRGIFKEGIDFMRAFGIYKYEEPTIIIQSGGKKIKYRNNSKFDVYYKFPNAKNAPNMFTANDEVVITSKIHGCNARFAFLKKDRLSLLDRIKRLFGNKWIDYDFVYGSHILEKGSTSQGFYSTNVWRTIADRYKIKERLKNWCIATGKEYIGDGIILYGEIYGPGIQKYYTYNLKDIDVKFFDVKINGQYIDDKTMVDELSSMNLPIVSALYIGPYDEEIVKNFQHNRFIPNTKVPEEGVVVKTTDGSRSKIAKFINPAYLEFQSKKEDSTDFH